jgi:phosphoribosylformylglycinamidine synthase
MKMSIIRRVFVEKKPEYAVDAGHLLHELNNYLGILPLEDVRILARYDIEGLSESAYRAALWTVFAEPPVDIVHEEDYLAGDGESAFAIEYLPGQYDQRADSAAQCLNLLLHASEPAQGPPEAFQPLTVACSKMYVLKGALAPDDIAKIKNYLINPIDSREAPLVKPETLNPAVPEAAAVEALAGFAMADEAGLREIQSSLGLAMTLADLRHTQAYFKDTEKRDPTETELKLLDTYWSDHCRHTTFLTELAEIAIDDGPLSAPIRAALSQYRQTRGQVYGDMAKEKPECLMDIALLPAKFFSQKGMLDDQEASNEINACSIIVDVDNPAAPGGNEPWLLMFKNETHTHPTEIEPFGGAATCLGGAIRDPMSGRGHVYQSMRVTGAGDPRTALEKTLPGKLPQRRITQEAVRGFTSYSNQVGVAAGHATEIYDEGYAAKRMELGAVLAAAPRAQVRREEPVPGDLVVMIGGPTGRDGIGGATGSSKSGAEATMSQCGTEFQKGDPIMERKLMRLYRRPEFARLIKKGNDFGAGGVSVAIGELADGLKINLDAVPKKYEDLNGTELALSESQERMAAVIAPGDLNALLALASEENLGATVIAEVTDPRRLVMTWRGKTIVDLDRSFLGTNGARQFSKARIAAPDSSRNPFKIDSIADLKPAWLTRLADLNTCSQRGLGERFDSTIGAATISAPFGGRRRRTPTESMAAKFPVIKGETLTASAMSYAFFPAMSRWSPFHGAAWAHAAAAAKLAAIGSDHKKLRFTLQEYFCKLRDEPERWGLPTAALLGALHAELAMEAPAIGGKDSMSGSYKDLDVPPTLVAFAVGVVRADEIATPELKGPGHSLVLVELPRTHDELPDWPSLHNIYSRIAALVRSQKALAIHTVGMDGLAAALSKMAFGNAVGMDLNGPDADFWFAPRPGSFVLELPPDLDIGLPATILGKTIAEPIIKVNGCEICLFEAEKAWEATLEPIFPTKSEATPSALQPFAPFDAPAIKGPSVKAAKPRVLLTVFPGTNGEYDTAAAFEKAGAATETLVFRNLSPKGIEESLEAMAKAISMANMVVIPGGFCAGDEPGGPGKFIAAAYRSPRVRDAIHELLKARDGLMLGIGNGFQALIKLGLVPFGEIREQRESDPTLALNAIHYSSRMAWTRVVSNASPWLMRVKPGDQHTVAVAYGEGRVIGPSGTLSDLMARGQVATQYVDEKGQPSMCLEYNPGGSELAIEGLLSPDGRAFGKMAHAERHGAFVWQNVPGDKDMGLFKSGVEYFG